MKEKAGIRKEEIHVKEKAGIRKEETCVKEGRRRNGSREFMCRGSFTVEAAFLLPVIVLLLAFILHLSVDWYESVRETAKDVDVLLQLDTRTYFLRQNTLQEILHLFD